SKRPFLRKEKSRCEITVGLSTLKKRSTLIRRFAPPSPRGRRTPFLFAPWTALSMIALTSKLQPLGGYRPPVLAFPPTSIRAAGGRQTIPVSSQIFSAPKRLSRPAPAKVGDLRHRTK